MKEYYFNLNTHKFSNIKNKYDLYGNSKPVLAKSIKEAEQIYNKRIFNNLRRIIRKYQNAGIFIRAGENYNSELEICIMCVDNHYEYTLSSIVSKEDLFNFLQKFNLIHIYDDSFSNDIFFTKTAYQSMQISTAFQNALYISMGGTIVNMDPEDLIKIFPEFKDIYLKFYVIPQIQIAKGILRNYYDNLSDEDKLKIEIMMNEGDC